MARTVKHPKTDLKTQIIDLPLDRLAPDPQNVRQDYRSEDVAALADNIAAEGLLQNLGVRPELDAEGQPTGIHLVSIGGRRLSALRLLVSRKALPKNASIPCNLRAAGAVTSASTAENFHRVPMHPAEAYAAFARMADTDGLTENEIASRFGVAASTVQKRLRLGRLSPVLLAALRSDEISETVAQAFAITDDHDAQERVYSQVSQTDYIDARSVRGKLTEGEVPSHDRRVLFVGLDAYEAAGGIVRRDLFDEGSGGTLLQDVALLDRLALTKLDDEANRLRAAGWGAVRASLTEPEELRSFTHALSVKIDLSADDETKLEALGKENDALIEVSECNGLSEEEEARAEQIEAEIEEIEDRRHGYSAETKAAGTAFLYLGGSGLRCFFGIPVGASEAGNGDDRSTLMPGSADRAPKPDLSGALMAELYAQRTAALQAQVADRPGLALRLMVQSMLLGRGYRWNGSVVRFTAQPPSLKQNSPGIEDTPAYRVLADLHDRRGDHLPGEDDAILPWLLTLDDTEVLALLAPLVASTIDAGSGDWLAGRDALALQTAQAANLDMAQWWQPTTESYFGRVSKAQIAEAVREAGAGPFSGDGKKADVAAAATRLMADSGWLPKPLRMPVGDASSEPVRLAAE